MHFYLETLAGAVFDGCMDFKLKVVRKKAAPNATTLTTPVTEEMRRDIQRIKGQCRENSNVINELTRQFWAQLIEKYDAGELELESA